jgi:hypothetical protein
MQEVTGSNPVSSTANVLVTALPGDPVQTAYPDVATDVASGYVGFGPVIADPDGT